MEIRSQTPANYTFVPDEEACPDDQLIARAMAILVKRMRRPTDYISSPPSVVQYLQLKLSVEPVEHFGVLFLDAQNGVVADETMFHGTVNHCYVHPNEIARRALIHNCLSVVLYHNHPSGLASPSEADKRLTTEIRMTLHLIDVKVLDHIVVGEGYYSFAEHGLL